MGKENQPVEFIDKETLNTFYKAAASIIEGYSDKKLKNLTAAFGNAYMEDLVRDRKKAKSFIANLPFQFYDYLAERFSMNLNEFPEAWLINDCRIYILLSTDAAKYIDDKIIKNEANTSAGNIYLGSEYLDNGSPEVAILYFNQVNHYIASYYKGHCYVELENYPNAIRNFQAFQNGLSEFFSQHPDAGFDLNPSLLFFIHDVQLELGYLYNATKHYDKAKIELEKVLTPDRFEDEFYILSAAKNELTGRTDFEILINNYLLALEKTGDYSTATKILQKVLKLIPQNGYYKNQLKRFREHKHRHDNADEILINIKPIKRPYNIQSFDRTRLIAREKILEDMILEQIKYRSEVFGKKLELYQDNNIYGRQYFLKEINGFLDLLLIDKNTDTLYVVELKRNSAGLEVVTQIENYMAAISKEITKTIKGIICLHQPNRALIEMIKTKKDIELFTYKFDFEKLG